MTEREVESEILATIEDITVAMQNADAATLDKLMSDRAGCVHIGTDPDEWFGKAQILAGISEAFTADDGPIHIKRGDISVHVQGDVAWAEGTTKFVAPDGTECPARTTGVFVHENGAWRAVQSHASIGVPNTDMFRR